MSRHGILSLDLATRLGWAYGDARKGHPVSGWHQLPKTGEELGPFAAAYDQWLTEMLAEALPGLVVFEEPIPPTAGRSTMTTICKLTGLCWHTEYVCQQRGIDVRKVHGGTWKSHFVGGKQKVSKAIKPYPVTVRCHQLGWTAVSDDNEADALGLWSYACSVVAPGAALRLTPLFAAAPQTERPVA